MEEEAVSSFSTLYDILRFALEDTTFTCHILYSRCNHYQKLLKRWSVIEQEVHPCICKPCSEEPEELVNNIIEVVEKAKATRTKNAVFNDNRSECSSFSCKSSTSGYKPRQSLEKSSNKSKILPNIRHRCEKKEPGSSDVKSSSCAKLRKSQGFQTTYQKDFSTKKLSYKPYANTKNSKLFKPTKASQIMSEKSVEYLLRKVTSNPSTTTSKVKPNPEYGTKTICKLHSSITSEPMYNTLKEAINIHGVPPELLKLLLTFHRYSSLNNISQVSQRKSGISYLQKLKEMNENTWMASSSEPIVNVFSQYTIILKNILVGKNNDLCGIDFSELEEELRSLGKMYQKVFDMDLSPQDGILLSKKKLVPQRTENNLQIQRALAGLWKRNYTLSGMEQSLFLSYNSKKDCKNLQKNFQTIQKLYLQIDILFTLQNNVFPLVDRLNSGHIALPKLYKTCRSLCDILTLPLPVILKL